MSKKNNAKSGKGSSKQVRTLLIAAVCIFVLILAVWVCTLAAKNIKLQKTLDEKRDILAAQQEENTILEALVDEENESALMEKTARDSGYVYPDERVYYANGS